MTYISPEQLAQSAIEALEFIPETLSPKDRMAIPAQEMPSQDPAVRCSNMNEVALGYSPEQARAEALRCLQCKTAPCIAGCPVGIDIPGFIQAIADGDNKKAVDILKQDSLLPAVCGRVCPQETQCQAECTIGKMLKDPEQSVSIGRIERFVADLERESGKLEPPPVKPETGKKVAIVGSGPAGLTVAQDCVRDGHAATVYESLPVAGGMLAAAIPRYRLTAEVLEQDIDDILATGIEIQTGVNVGKDITLEELRKKYLEEGQNLGCALMLNGLTTMSWTSDLKISEPKGEK